MLMRSLRELSIDTQTLESMMIKVPIGDMVTYHDLSASISRDVQAAARGNMNSARRRLEREHHIVFGAVKGLGLKRLDDVGKVAAANTHVARGRNQFRSAKRVASAVDNFDALPNDAKVEHHVVMAKAVTLLHMTSPQTTKRLQSALADAHRKFEPKESLELMKSSL